MSAADGTNDFSDCRALVPLAPAMPNEPSSVTTRRGSASFIAHLIAANAKLPQTRQLRRIGPGEGAAAYAATQLQTPMWGSILSRAT